MNRKQLTQAIMAWLHRSVLRTPVGSDFDVAASFIVLCEQDMNERLRARCMVVTENLTVDGQYTELPDDYLEMLDARLAGGGPPLTYVTRETAANAYWYATQGSPGANPGAIGAIPPDFYPVIQPPAYPWNDGTPRHFSVIGSRIEWSPFPSPPSDPDAAPVWPVCELSYYQRIALGMADSDTNAVLATYPALYIYGSLIHAAPFLRDDSRVDLWKGLYDGAIAGANAEHERSRTQGSPLRQTYRRLA